jgi:hypothetical protein
MSIQDTDYFLIDDGGVVKKVTALKLKTNMLGDYSSKKLLVNLSDYSSRFIYAGDLHQLQASHWMLLDRAGQSYKVSGTEVLRYIGPPPTTPELFAFTSFTFQSADLTGRTGPTKSELLSFYDTSSFAWLNNSLYFDVDSNAQGVQMFTVPSDGTYRIQVAGASGGYSYDSSRTNRVGRGAEVYGDFELTKGTILRIVVGQKGRPISTSNPHGPLSGYSYNSGGGGGSFVFYTLSDLEPLVVAGGGGGGAYSGTSGYAPNASTDLTGNPGTGVNNEGNNLYSGLLPGQSLGYGGINNNGTPYKAGGGAGWKGNGYGGHTRCSRQSPIHIQGGWSKSKSLDTSNSTTNGGPFMGGWGGNYQAGGGAQVGGFGGGGGGTGRCGSCQAGGGGGYTGGGQASSTDNSPTREALAGGGNYVSPSASNRTYSGLRNAGESGFVTITKL